MFYEGEVLKAPYEIIEEYEGMCPQCGEKLSYIPRTVEVRAFTANMHADRGLIGDCGLEHTEFEGKPCVEIGYACMLYTP